MLPGYARHKACRCSSSSGSGSNKRSFAGRCSARGGLRHRGVVEQALPKVLCHEGEAVWGGAQLLEEGVGVARRRAVAAPQLQRLALVGRAQRAGGRVAVAQRAQVVRVATQKVDCGGGGEGGLGVCGIGRSTAPATASRQGGAGVAWRRLGAPEGSSSGALVCESRLLWNTTGSVCSRSTCGQGQGQAGRQGCAVLCTGRQTCAATSPALSHAPRPMNEPLPTCCRVSSMAALSRAASSWSPWMLRESACSWRVT